MNFYEKQLTRKREWLPVCGNTKTTELADDVIGKCLSLRNLEIDVRDWLHQEMKATELPSTIKKVLLSNAQDEDKHKLVLDMASDVYGDLIKDEFVRHAQYLEQEWLSCADHPITKAYVLETSVFFIILPLLRFYGGVSLSVVSADISSDEAVHAAVNRQLSNDLGYVPSVRLKSLRRETVAWLVDNLKVDVAGKRGKKQTWLKMSDDLLEHGVSDLTETRRAMMPAFFEIPNNSLPKYN